MSHDGPTTRRDVLKAVGGTIGGGAAVAGVAGTAAAAAGDLDCDVVLNEECPITDSAEGPIAEAGTKVYEACTGDDGTQYYFVCEDGYEQECESFGPQYDFMVVGYVDEKWVVDELNNCG